MPGQYAPLPNPRSTALDANQEMAEAFDLGSDSDGEQDDETTPLNVATSATPHSASSATAGSLLRDARPPVPPTPGTYDFEREYDFPPPGSPPRPSSRALPNDYGNSNGIVPTSPVERPEHRPSFFRRMMGTILPAKYAPLPTTEQRRIGGGIENDGVFSNVVAKPQVAQVVTSSDGTVHIMPEESSKDAPPVRLFYFFSVFLLTLFCIDIPRSSSRRSADLLGNNCTCTHVSGSQRRPHRRRPRNRLRRSLFPQRIHFILLPIRWIPPHLPNAHNARSEVRFARRARSHPHPIRLLLPHELGR